MKSTRSGILAVAFAAGCATVALPALAEIGMPDCIAGNYDATRHLFTLRNPKPDQPSQQCELTVSAPGEPASATRIPAGRYVINLSDGSDGGAGGTLRAASVRGGGGGGGGAGAHELQRVVDLVEGVYKLTLGAGGPGGSACMRTPTMLFPGGPGWLGSTSSLVRLATAEVIIGSGNAEKYLRPSKRGNERLAGNQDGHGGSGPDKANGGRGGHMDVTGLKTEPAEAGQRRGANEGGDPGVSFGDKNLASSGGGGGASTKNEGGDGGGDLRSHWGQPPERGLLGSGGGGGEGTPNVCGAGGRGGDGFMVLRAYQPKAASADRILVP